jgi:hypothetical protein
MSDIVPFGKYKGQPVDVLANDKQYCEWLMSQGDFIDRYSNIKTLIINNFKEPEDTPEHNKIQGLFLNDEICLKVSVLFAKILPDQDWFNQKLKSARDFIDREQHNKNDKLEIKSSYRVIIEKKFEFEGADVSFIVKCFIDIHRPSDYPHDWVSTVIDRSFRAKIELKPSVGDDYPSILRQMKANSCNILVYGSYVGIGVCEEDFSQMMKLSGVDTIRIDQLNEVII